VGEDQVVGNADPTSWILILLAILGITVEELFFCSERQIRSFQAIKHHVVV